MKINNFFLLSFIIAFIIVLSGYRCHAQAELQKIIPLSPNAAEISRYTEQPVDYFTGIPQISVPIYSIRSGDLNLPLSVSYYAGGNKVEAIASWVGLSWSLNSIPIISRSVNGIPDENGAYLSSGSNSVQQAYDQMKNGDHASINQLMSDARKGLADSEPDVYSFNIQGKSGKFVYNQALQKFDCTPMNNIKIVRSGDSFVITSDDGTTYYFQDKETSTTQSSGPSNTITTSWMITKIINATKTDSLVFNYNIETNYNRTFISATKYQFISGTICSDIAKPNSDGLTGALTINSTLRLSSIAFKGGHVDFIPKATEREDLNGGVALDYIKVFDKSNSLTKQFQFHYKYLSGSNSGAGCYINDTYKSYKWMLLTDIDEVPIDGSNALIHKFEYEESLVPPCRNNPTQDYWGYYNGAVSNISLIPQTTVPNSNIVVPGADRAVYPAYTQFGILKKMIYPTGGFTTFNYENNMVVDHDLPAIYFTGSASLEAGLDEDPPTTKTLTTTFVINNPPDRVLNNNNINGGAYLTIDMGGVGVQPGSAGAVVNLQGPNDNFNFSASFENHYLPNGSYQITATFNQDPPNYQNFYCIATWKIKDTTTVNTYAGGIRIKEIRTYENSSAVPLINRYIYTADLSTTASSGRLFNKQTLNYFDVIDVVSNQVYYCAARYMRINSFSNQSQVTHSGSSVGYTKVFIQSASPNITGMTSYSYTYSMDQPQDDWTPYTVPYTPLQTMESFRGQIDQKIDYRYVNGNYEVAKATDYLYTEKIQETPAAFGLKADKELLEPGTIANEGDPVPYYAPYKLKTTWSAPSFKRERTYETADQTKFVETVSNYLYDDPYHQLTETSTLASNGKTLKKVNYYPYNLTLSGDAEIGRNWLINKNNISVVLKEQNYSDATLLNSVTTNYKSFDGFNLVKPYSVSIQYQNNQAVKTILFNRYNNSGNLLEQQIQNGPSTSYLWAYNNIYPVAELKNTTYSQVENILGTGTLIAFESTLPSISTIQTLLLPLKTQLPACYMTTYTYAPLVGMTSATDAKGQTTYYEYDGFQRLVNIKDQYGNILKHTDYHYQNQ